MTDTLNDASGSGGLKLFELHVRTGEELVELVESRLPLLVSKEPPHDPMRLVRPALLARGAGTLRAINRLASLRRETDAGVLLRVLLEAMITVAWLSCDQDSRRFALWVKHDSAARLAMHNDLPADLPPLLPPEMHAFHSGVVDRVKGKLPDLRTRATEADADWAPRLPGVLKPGNDWTSFLGLYRVVVRLMNAYTHPGSLGLNSVLKSTPAGDVVEMERVSEVPSALTLAAPALGLGLYVSSVAEGWPEKSTLEAIMHGASAPLRRDARA